jgi:hypothetical protein
MSGSVAAAFTGAIGLAFDLSTEAMPVSLGGFIFQRFEIPETISWGGSQRLAVHKLIGGTRITDAMGPDDADITWSGIFLSPDAMSRADTLNEMRKTSGPFELIFGDRYYLVMISDFSAEMRKISHVPYKLTLCVLTDLSQTVPSYVSPLQAVTDDISIAIATAFPA